MSMFTSRILTLLLVLVAAQAQAQQYRWVDQKGRVQYTDTPPPATAKGIEKKNFNAGKSDQPAEPFALQIARKAAPVKLYTAPRCADCDSARKYLNKRGIPFTEISVEFDSQAAELKALTGRVAVPVMIVAGKMLRGFEESDYERQIDIAGYPKTGTLPERNQTAPIPQKPPAKVPAAPAAKAPAAGGAAPATR